MKSEAPLPAPELLTDRQAAALCGIGVRSLWAYAGTSKAPAPVKVGGCTRWRRSDLGRWIAGGCQPVKEGEAEHAA